MKNIILIGFLGLLIFSSCENQFLEKPQGSDLNVDTVFVSQQNSLSAISQAYAMSLTSGLTLLDYDPGREHGVFQGVIAHFSGELNAIKFNWEESWKISRVGFMADAGNGAPLSSDGFNFNYKSIRQSNLVIENIDKVVDMTDDEKEVVKAEMKTLIAYRYQEMFKRYGGVPLVKSSLSANDDLKISRASLQETLDYIVQLCDEAAPVLPASQERIYKGRVTKGVALAIKAEALLFAARPLFNSTTPYLDLGENNSLICFGNTDKQRWQDAINASKAVLDWAAASGCHIIDTNSPLDDYGTAVSTPNNPEVILAYKNQFPIPGPNGHYYSPHGPSGGANAMSFWMLKQYAKEDGSEQEWAHEEASYAEYASKMNEMEPRYKASAAAAGFDAWNNPNDEHWTSTVLANSSTWSGRGGTEGCGRRVKFWYHAGTRDWFEFPLYRLAETYLGLAEAYNELGKADLALPYLNVIRDRAGLPDITETNQEQLRKIIRREWAVEFYEENHQLWDVKHWKHEDIANGIIGGIKKGFAFTYVNGSYGLVADDYLTYVTEEKYTGFWNTNQYLEPIPAYEINKGYLIQNPGY